MSSRLADVTPEHLEDALSRVRAARTVVLKVGSNVLVGGGLGVLHRRHFVSLVESIARLRERGLRVVLVTSGAVATGRKHVAARSGSKTAAPGAAGSGVTAPEAGKQALAAIGQPMLMHYYAAELEAYDLLAAQVLLTRDDFSHRERFLNVRRTFQELRDLANVVPIVNENDTVANDELRFGDNDSLAAQVAVAVEADALVILSDIDGVYDANPSSSPDAKRLLAAYGTDPALVAMAGGSESGVGTGGMASKIRAAGIACRAGIPTIIGPGRRHEFVHEALTLTRLEDQPAGTVLVPSDARLSAKKSWIRFSARPEGTLRLDPGAARAVVTLGKSLLPSGIVEVLGDFSAGAAIELRGDAGEFALGLARYGSDELRRIAGRKSAEIEAILGYSDGPEVVHSDDIARDG